MLQCSIAAPPYRACSSIARRIGIRYGSRFQLVLLATALSSAAGHAQVPKWLVREELRIGQADHPTQSLTRIGSVAIGPLGSMYVSQPNEQSVRVFDHAGGFVRVIGGPGDGPGEMRGLHSIGFVRDSFYVTDNVLRRVTVFRPDGTVSRASRLATPLLGGGRVPEVYAPTVPSLMLDDGSSLAWPSASLRSRAAGNTRDPLLKLSPDGMSVDTIARAEVETPNAIADVRGRRVGVRRPFADGPLYAFLADGTGVLVVHRRVAADQRAGTFEVIKIGLRGDTVFARAFDYAPKRMSTRLVDLAIKEIEERLAGRSNAPDDAQIRDALDDGGHIPHLLPPVTEIASGLDGSLWLKRERTTEARAEWQVLDSSGRTRAIVRLPRKESVKAAMDTVLVTAGVDDLDVPYIVRYRIEIAREP